jgi:hypothetical protein
MIGAALLSLYACIRKLLAGNSLPSRQTHQRPDFSSRQVKFGQSPHLKQLSQLVDE